MGSIGETGKDLFIRVDPSGGLLLIGGFANARLGKLSLLVELYCLEDATQGNRSHGIKVQFSLGSRGELGEMRLSGHFLQCFDSSRKGVPLYYRFIYTNRPHSN